MNFNFLKNKNVENNKREESTSDVFNIKDLYVAVPALITRDAYNNSSFWYNEDDKYDEEIVCILVGDSKVKNVLNGREYFIFQRCGNIRYHWGTFMVNDLIPLESRLDDKYKIREKITKEEIGEFLYPKKNEVKETTVKDVVLKQISETDDKISKSSLDSENKEELKKKLVEIAGNYVKSLRDISNSKSTAISLNVNHESIVDLRREVMKKLVEIEMILPPEEIDTLSNELEILEQKILKKG